MLFPTPSLVVLSAFAALSSCASLVQVQNFGTNPTKINMYLYAPDKVAAKPAIIVAVSGRKYRLLLGIAHTDRSSVAPLRWNRKPMV
jgi:hypothetical protein